MSRACAFCGKPTPSETRKVCSNGCLIELRRYNAGRKEVVEKRRGWKHTEESLERMRTAFAAREVNPTVGRPKPLKWRIGLLERIRQGKVGFYPKDLDPYVTKDGRSIRMRSSWEVKTAEWLDRKGIPWEYEPKVLVIEEEDDCYLPDFLRLDTGEYIEVKGHFPEDEQKRIERFSRKFPIVVWREPELRALGIL